MNKEEILKAISDDKMMPFIQPDQLAEIVHFVIKNYKPSLPSDLDEAAHSYAWEKQEHHIDFDGDEYLDYGPRYDAFKAGAKWDAGQGVSMLGRVGIYGVDVESITKELREAGFNHGEEIILQIRKKQ